MKKMRHCLYIIFSLISISLGVSAEGDIGDLIPKSLFETMLLHRNDIVCRHSKGFYTYEAFIAATDVFPKFASVGDTTTRKREIAAFFAQTSHETTVHWPAAPDGPYFWGYCSKEGVENPLTCIPSLQWPCAPGKSYHNRGPFRLTYNYNYGDAGQAIGLDLLNNPDLVAQDATVSFKAALWFWMTPQSPKPSCHDVISGNWNASSADVAAGRLPGYGVITNIRVGRRECGRGNHKRGQNRIGFYRRYCQLLGVSPGANIDCGKQRPFPLY